MQQIGYERDVEVEILVENATYEGGWKYAARVTAEDPTDFDGILFVARTLYDEADNGIYGAARRTTVFTRVYDDEGNEESVGILRTEERL